jgi:hypothetical protein
MTKQMRSIEIEITEIVYFPVLIWELNRLRSQLLFCVIIIIIIIIIIFQWLTTGTDKKFFLTVVLYCEVKRKIVIEDAGGRGKIMSRMLKDFEAKVYTTFFVQPKICNYKKPGF